MLSLPLCRPVGALPRLFWITLFAVIGVSSHLAAYDWPEITEEEIALTASTIDPDAAAEILIDNETVNDSEPTSARVKRFRRVKIFAARAIEDFSPIDIYYDNGERVRRVDARVRRPDGSFVELDKKDVYDRETFKHGRSRQRTKSFSLPGIEPGCIIDYTYEIVAYNRINAAGRIYKPRGDYPVRHAKYSICMFRGLFSYYTGYGVPQPEKKGAAGFDLEMHDLPPVSPDEYQPPYMTLYPWLITYYWSKRLDVDDRDEYWSWIGGILWDYDKHQIEPKQRAVREKVAELLPGIKEDDKKLARLYQFCMQEIKDPFDRNSGYTIDELDDLHSNDSPGETMRHGYAIGYDRSFLFASLARAAGFDARLAWANDISLCVFSERQPLGIAVSDLLVAVKIGEDFRYYDLEKTNLPPGDLAWQNESVSALLVWDDKWKWSKTQAMPKGHTHTDRKAQLRIDDTGTLTGKVEIRYYGNHCVEQKDAMAYETPKEREERARNSIKARIPQAQVEDIRFENLEGFEQPLTVHCTVTIPDYAEFVGDRLFFNPSFFQRGAVSFLIREERDTAVVFPYSWNEKDQVRFDLPEGWEWDKVTVPHSLLETSMLSHKLQIGSAGPDNIIYTRDVNCGIMYMPKEKYSALWKIFGEINAQDQQPIGFVKKATKPAEPPPAVEEATPAATTTDS